MTPQLPLTNLPHDPARGAECSLMCVAPSSADTAKSCYRTKPGTPYEERLAALIERWVARCEHTEGGCWLWPGARGMGGYSHVMVPQPDGSRKSTGLHRVVYEHRVGRVPKHLDIDHLCRNRACVNPAHLQPVTTRVNLRRGVRWPNRKENPMPQLLIVQRADRPEHTPETEGLLVEVFPTGARLVLDDGVEVTVDRRELIDALSAVAEVAA